MKMNRELEKLKKELEKLKHVDEILGSKPKFFTLAEKYVEAVSKLNQEKTNKGLFNLSSDERKELLKEFSLSWSSYPTYFGVRKNSEKALHLLLETVFACDLIYDEEISRRYMDLLYAVFKFEEVIPNIYLCATDRYIYVANAYEGKFIKYKRGSSSDVIKFEVEGEEGEEFIYVRYKDGSLDIICTFGKFNKNYESAEVLIDKEYLRVEICGRYFRSHTLLLTLTYGIDLVKYTLGRNNLLTVDHINGIPYDNRLSNLRIITRKDNTLLKSNPKHDALDFLQIHVFKTKPLRNRLGCIVHSPEYMWV